MQADSIISDTISEEIRKNGHRSIRFSPDGFSILISDASYRPVFLRRYPLNPEIPRHLHPAECKRVLEEMGLLKFEGESVMVIDTGSVTLVPGQFFDASQSGQLLDKAAMPDPSDQVLHRTIRGRDLIIVYAVSAVLNEFGEELGSSGRILSSSECLVSLSDQVKASDHQRGFLMAEVQNQTLDLLVIREDQIQLLNRYDLKDPSDFIYHTLNTARQLEMDRETTPVYLSGIVHEEHELFGLLGKYIRQVRTTPYYLEELSRPMILQYMLLSEGSKCA